MSPKAIGLVAHPHKKGVADFISAVSQEFRKLGIPVQLHYDAARLVGQKSGPTVSQLAKASDLLVVLGGDGTILNVAGQLGEDVKPIFGINVGSLGFLTCSTSIDYRDAVAAVAQGRINFSDRAMVQVHVASGGTTTLAGIGLNDVVLSRGKLSRLILLQVRVDGEELTEFNADGIIVATPTGSTAYSLSAGGPIMSPESGVFVITPICPHALTNRSVIVREESSIEIEVTDPDDPVYLSVDGREPSLLKLRDIITVRRTANKLPLAVMPDVSFFGVVRQKLKWSGSNV
jgi:NAD+ kinase